MRPKRAGLARLLLFLLACAMLLAGYRLVSGKPLGLRAWASSQVRRAGAFLASGQVKDSASAGYANIIFLHHSVGRRLVTDGALREALSARGYALWEQDYNFLQVTDPQGHVTGWSYEIPGNNTDPDGLARVFAQPEYPLPLNAWSGLLQHDVILFKSCFSASQIETDEELRQYQAYYQQIRAEIDQHPDKIFLLLTQPPLNPAETTPENAARARALADWLAHPTFTEGHSNLAVFDLFDALADDANVLKVEYREGSDSHPVASASQDIATRIAEFIDEAIITFRAKQPR